MTPKEAIQACLEGNKVVSTYIYPIEICFQDPYFQICLNKTVELSQNTSIFYERPAWEIVKPEPKIITWYTPSIVWIKDEDMPRKAFGYSSFYKSKEEVLKQKDKSMKILTWEEIQAPEIWEEVK